MCQSINVLHTNIALPLSPQHPYTSHALTLDLSTCSTSFTHNMQSHCLCSLPPQIRDGSRLSVHLILDDPAGNSYIQVCAVQAPLTSLTHVLLVQLPHTLLWQLWGRVHHLHSTTALHMPHISHLLHSLPPLTLPHPSPSPLLTSTLVAAIDDTRSTDQNELLGLDQINVDWPLHVMMTS